MPNTLTHKEPSKTLIIAAFAALYIIWGSTYLAIVLAIKNIPPFLMAGTRFFVAGLALYSWCRLQGQATPPFNSVTKISFSGILMLFFGTGAVVWVEQYISSGLTAIIVATLPLWFVIIDKHQWKFHFSNKWIITGLLIGFGGVLMLFVDKKTISFSGDKMKVISFFVMILGTISWAIGSLYSKYKKVEGSTGMKASIQMMAAGLVSILVGLIIGEHYRVIWSNISWGSVLALLYLIVMGSLIGYMAYIWLLSVRPPSLVGTYAYVNPVVAVFLGWLIVHEEITRQQVIALVIILSGVLLVNFSKR
ncbi:MAG: EamA family transporter [Chitinophagaceae bacterium]|nr:MAG: EamA family transporter [Chitinophagaceae bacterium]